MDVETSINDIHAAKLRGRTEMGTGRTLKSSS